MELYLEPADPPHTYTFVRPNSSVDALPGLRLAAFADLRQHITNTIHRPHAIQKCVVDTGAFLSIIPSRVAQYLDTATITWLPFHSSFPVGLQVLVIAGGSVPYELGELSARLRDKRGNVIDIRFVAKFTRDGGTLNIPLTLGLRGGFPEGRTLSATPDATEPFGAIWTLANP